MAFCTRCGASVPEAAAFCPGCGAPGGGTRPAAVSVSTASAVQYGGFWRRFLAVIVDEAALHLAQGVLFAVFIAPAGFLAILENLGRHDDEVLIGQAISLWVRVITLSLVVGWLYRAWLESSQWQATLGKMVLGMKVTDLQGQRITFAKATMRYVGRILSGLTLCIGYLMAAFTERKQALHDKLADTLVIRV